MGLDAAALSRAARRLGELWSTGSHVEELPVDERPSTLEEGWAIQRLLGDVAGPGIGWKIASTTAGSQALLGIDHPLMGTMYTDQLVASGSTVVCTRMPFIEAEVAVRIVGDMDRRRAPFGRADVLRHIGSLHAGLEMPDLRVGSITTTTAAMVTADFIAAGHYVVGPALDINPEDLARVQAEVWRNGVIEAVGCGADVMGDPINALLWLADALALRGHNLADGDLVTTGACAAIGDVRPGDRCLVSVAGCDMVELWMSGAEVDMLRVET